MKFAAQIELEKAIIYEMLFGDVTQQEKIFAECDPAYFTDAEARKALVAGAQIYREGGNLDLTLIDTRVDKKTTNFIVGIVTQGKFVTSEALGQYIGELCKRKKCRDAKAAAEAAAKALAEGDETAIYELRASLEKLDGIGAGNKLTTLSDAVTEAINRIGAKQKSNIRTGFYLIDDYFNGVAPGRLAILAAGTGTGKSAFASNLAWNVAKTGGIVLYISLEMPEHAIANRIIANITGISKNEQIAAVAKNDEKTVSRIVAAVEEIKDKSILFYARGEINPQAVVTFIRQVKAIYGACDLVIVDYLQLMRPTHRADTREREIADISRALAAASLSEQTCIFALSQINRKADERSGNKLHLSDIRESAAPTHDASAVFMLYVDDEQDKDEETWRMSLDLVKNRENDIGCGHVIFHRPTQRFTDVRPS